MCLCLVIARSVYGANTAEEGAAYSLLIQHLCRSPLRLYSWPLVGSSTCRPRPRQTHRYTMTPYTHRLTNPSPDADITTHHWLLANLQHPHTPPPHPTPPWEITQSLSSHQGVKYTPLEKQPRREGGGTGLLFGVVRGQEVASSKCKHVRFGDGK